MTTDVHSPPSIGPERQPPSHLPAPRRHAGRWIAPFFMLAAMAVVAGWLWRRRAEGLHRPAEGAPPVGVTTATARRGDIGVYQQSIGTVTPLQTAAIASQVTGVIVDVHYTEGQYVEKGAPLLEIDARSYRANLKQAEGTLERDEHVLAQSQMDLERYRQAWARNAIAKQTLDDQEKIVLQNTGLVKNDRGVVEYNRLQVEYCHITAPIAGRVGLRLLDRGNLVQANGGTTLVVVTQVEPITVVFSVPEDQLAPIRNRLRDGAKLSVDALDRLAKRKVATGTLSAIDNQVDTTTGTVKARAEFDNGDDALFPNEFVNARVLVDTLQGVTLIPASAIQQNGTTSFVYVIADGIAHMRKVQPGVSNEGTTQVDGISPGDAVANSSFERLREGVHVAPSGPPPASSSGSKEP